VVANTAKLSKILGWEPNHADLDTIVTTALNWERKELDESGSKTKAS